MYDYVYDLNACTQITPWWARGHLMALTERRPRVVTKFWTVTFNDTIRYDTIYDSVPVFHRMDAFTR